MGSLLVVLPPCDVSYDEAFARAKQILDHIINQPQLFRYNNKNGLIRSLFI